MNFGDSKSIIHGRAFTVLYEKPMRNVDRVCAGGHIYRHIQYMERE